MKKSIYCVGQRVLYGCDRQAATVRRITQIGRIQIVLDNFPLLTCDVSIRDLKPIQDYLDVTSYFYHHSRFGEYQEKARNAYIDYQYYMADLEGPLARLWPAKTMAFLSRRVEEAIAEYVKFSALHRVAIANMAQWRDGDNAYTLDHHFPLINPENLEDFSGY